MSNVGNQLEIRPMKPAEFATAVTQVESVFLETSHPESIEAERPIFEFDRSTVILDAGKIVATTALFTRELTVPGGPVPAAAVSWVSVASTHRRRGLLTRLMTDQLTELHESASEPIAVLWGSEAVIYGRYGYGVAARGSILSGRTPELGLRSDLKRAEGSFTVTDPTSAKTDLAAVYEQVRHRQPGLLDRNDDWWTYRLFDPENKREGATALVAAVHTGPDGPDGYALYSAKNIADDTNRPNGQVNVRELVATTPAAFAAVWDFVTSLDLIRTIEWRLSPVGGSLTYALTDPRALRERSSDTLWIRLVDLDRALAARTYSAPADLVFEVADKRCPWNEGRWRLRVDSSGAGECARTDDEPDLSLSIAELGASYLGGTSLTTLAEAGLITEHRPGAVREATIAFSNPVAPYCPEVF